MINVPYYDSVIKITVGKWQYAVQNREQAGKGSFFNCIL
jgi:hypothetical protein